MKILVTGSSGFIGRHLCLALRRHGLEYLSFDLGQSEEELEALLASADFVFHLAGVNRPSNPQEYYEGNYGLTQKLIDILIRHHHFIPIVFASSTQAELDNDYGKSKKMAEDALFASGLPVYVYRLSNVFGPGCRPHYNSVVATFCDNLRRGEALIVNDAEKVVCFHYVEDVVEAFMGILVHDPEGKKEILSVDKAYECSVAHLADLLSAYKAIIESSLHLPLLYGKFEYKLFKTLLSYLTDETMPLNFSEDHRGHFQELYKSKVYGQISENMAYPGVTKGGHYHTRKKEIFLTVIGQCEITQRNLETGALIVDEVSGDNPNPITILLGHSHQIKNIGAIPSYTLMWISEPYDPNDADTFVEAVE